MPLPIITPADLRLVLRDLISADASLEDLRDARRIVANLSADDVRRTLDRSLRDISARISADFD